MGWLRKSGQESKAMMASSPDTSYVSEMVRQCQAYTSGMNTHGRDRFIACVLANVGMGYRVCLWDPAVAPCGHDADHTAHPKYDIDFDE